MWQEPGSLIWTSVPQSFAPVPYWMAMKPDDEELVWKLVLKQAASLKVYRARLTTRGSDHVALERVVQPYIAARSAGTVMWVSAYDIL